MYRKDSEISKPVSSPMKVQPEEEEKDKDIKKRNLLVIFFFALLPIFLVVLIFYAYSNLLDVPDDEVEVVEKEVHEADELDAFANEDLEGEIFLTLSPFGYEDEEPAQPNIYRFDLSTKELAPLDFFKESYYHNHMASFSPSLEEMVFVKSYGEGKNKVMMYYPETEELKSLTLFLDYFPRNPRFSPDGEIVVYWGGEDLSSPETSSVYLVSTEGIKEKLVNGAYPVFSPNGDMLVFLKNDGLYTFDFNTEEELLVVDLTDEEVFPDLNLHGQDWYSFRFNISDSGDFLVVTNTLGRSNRIFEIESWSSFEYSEHSEPEFSQPIWPVFSPCDRYLALEEYRFSERGKDGDLRLSIYDLETLEIVGGVSIDGYELDFVWVSDWIIR